MKACFINPPVRDFYLTSVRRQPLGLLYLIASVEAAGFEASLINGHSPKKKRLEIPEEFGYLRRYIGHPDPGIAFPFSRYSHFGLSYQEIGQRIRRSDADLFFVPSMFTAYHRESDEVIAMVKRLRPGAPIVTGGHHASLYPEECLTISGADYVIRGEGEAGAVALLECMREGGDLARVPGLVYRKNGGITRNPRPETADIDAIPFPARDRLLPRDFTAYRKKAVAMIASRGCPNDCAFCTVRAVWGGGYRARSVESVLAEIDECVARYGASLVNFEDDNLFPTRERAAALLEGLAGYQERNGNRLDLTAMNGVSIEGLDPGIVAAMRRAGFREINISLMSRSEELQRRYRRPFDSGEFARIARAARALGMNVRAYFILGLPGQTAAEARDTVGFLKGLGVKCFSSVYYDVRAPREEWPLQRSSAFYNETGEMGRDDLMRLFNECR